MVKSKISAMSSVLPVILQHSVRSLLPLKAFATNQRVQVASSSLFLEKPPPVVTRALISEVRF